MVMLAPFLFTKCALSFGIHSSAHCSSEVVSNGAAVTATRQLASNEISANGVRGRMSVVVDFVHVEDTRHGGR